MRRALVVAGLLAWTAVGGRAAAPIAPGGYTADLADEQLLVYVHGTSVIVYSEATVTTDAPSVAVLYPVPFETKAELAPLDAARRLQALAMPTTVRHVVRPGSLLTWWRRHKSQPRPVGAAAAATGEGDDLADDPLAGDNVAVVSLPIDHRSMNLHAMPLWLGQQLPMLCSGEQLWLVKEPRPGAIVVVWAEVGGMKGRTRTVRLPAVRLSYACDKPLVPFRAPQPENLDDAAKVERPINLATLTDQEVRPVQPDGYPPFPDAARTCAWRPPVPELTAAVQDQLGPDADLSGGPVLCCFTANVPITGHTDDLLLEHVERAAEVRPRSREELDVGIVPVDLIVVLALLLGVVTHKRRGRDSSSSATALDPPEPEE